MFALHPQVQLVGFDTDTDMVTTALKNVNRMYSLLPSTSSCPATTGAPETLVQDAGNILTVGNATLVYSFCEAMGRDTIANIFAACRRSKDLRRACFVHNAKGGQAYRVLSDLAKEFHQVGAYEFLATIRQRGSGDCYRAFVFDFVAWRKTQTELQVTEMETASFSDEVGILHGKFRVRSRPPLRKAAAADAAGGKLRVRLRRKATAAAAAPRIKNDKQRQIKTGKDHQVRSLASRTLL